MKKKITFLLVAIVLLSTIWSVSAEDANISQSYGTVVNNLIQQYGMCEEISSFAPEDSSASIGLLGGKIVDIDNDGYQEMIVFYGDSLDSYENQRSNGSFVFCDVWDAVGGIATRILHIPINIYTDEYSMLLSHIDDTYYLYDVDSMHPLEDAYGTSINVYSFSRNSASKVITLADDYIFGENKKTILKDGQWSQADDATFTRLRSDYVHPAEDKLLFSTQSDKSMRCGDGSISQKESLNQFLWDIDHPYIRVELNGEKLDFSHDPVLQDGRTLVPMRTIFEAMGATVDWNAESQTVSAGKDDTVISLTINQLSMEKNGQTVSLDVAPQLFYDMTFVPVRVIAESFGCQVKWDDAQKTVRIYN